MSFFASRYYSVNRNLLRLMGVWPGQKLLQKLVLRSLIIAYGLLFLIVSITVFLNSRRTLNGFAEIAAHWSIVVIALQKYIHYCFNENTIKVLMEYVKSSWEALNDKEEYSIMHASSEEGRLFVLHSVYFFYIFMFVYSMLPFTPCFLDLLVPLNESRMRRYPYSNEYVPPGKNYFYPLGLQISLGGMLLATVFLATDTMIVVFIQHACGMFRIASYKLLHAFDGTNMSVDTSHKCTKNRLKIIEGIKYHKKAIKFTADIVTCYQWTTFFSTVLGVITSSFHIFCVSFGMVCSYDQQSKAVVVNNAKKYDTVFNDIGQSGTCLFTIIYINIARDSILRRSIKFTDMNDKLAILWRWRTEGSVIK